MKVIGWWRGLCLAVILAGLTVNSTLAETEETYDGNCRFGLTSVTSINKFDIAPLGAGAYLNWGLTPSSEPSSNIEYIHVVRLRNVDGQFIYDVALPKLQVEFESRLRTAIDFYRGQAWLVGNEPDTTFENQDSLTPEQYALAYRRVFHLIKSIDPTAQIGIGTIVQPTPVRLLWLERMWRTYEARFKTSPPSDFWSIHSFILRENVNDWGTGLPTGLDGVSGELYTLEQTDDIEIFKSRLFSFRRWLAERGERDKPLWITEYGSLLPHDSAQRFVTQPIEQARDYMLATFHFLESVRDPEIGYPLDDDRLVQRWFWYSLDDELSRFGGSLFDPATGQRTLIGDAFAVHVQDQPPKPELRLSLPTNPIVWPRQPAGNVLVSVVISNAGTASITRPYQVTWFVGEPESAVQVVATSHGEAGSLPGCGSATTVRAAVHIDPKVSGSLFVMLESDDLTQPVVIEAGEWRRPIGR